MGERTRTLKVDYLARVEGETSLTIKLKGGRATEVRLAIFEPPRLFEGFLRGRSFLEAPDITSRICGICPAAYLFASCQAMEDALGLQLEAPLKSLRRLLFCGEWLESHALHVFLLHAPDFLGYPDGIAMARDHGEWVRRGLRMKKAGNALMACLGGREIHPINVRVGGFYSTPTRAELQRHVPELEWGRRAVEEALQWAAGFTYPELERDYAFVALQSPHAYPITEGRLAASDGLDVPVGQYLAHFVEEQVPHSTALHTRRRHGRACLSGPLARFNLNFERLFPSVQALARRVGLTVPCRNPYRSLLVRLVEMAQAFEEALRIIEGYVPPSAPFVEAPPRAAVGHGATEAPRGLLYHRYVLDGEGAIREACIVPPTSRNQLAIEEDLAQLAPVLASLPRREATRTAEHAVRNHDPCISCSTHFLTLHVEGA